MYPYEHYVPSQSGNPNKGYHETRWGKDIEKLVFQTDELWKIFEKLVDRTYWANYNYPVVFVKFHKMCWHEYWTQYNNITI